MRPRSKRRGRLAVGGSLMGRAKRLNLPDSVIEFGRTGALGPRPFAVENRQAPKALDDRLGGGHEIPEVEDPADVSARNTLLGEPIEYETETETVAGKPQTQRRVVRRGPPVEFGPRQRWEVRHQDGSTEVHVGQLSALRRAAPDAAEKANRQRLGIVGAPLPERTSRLKNR